MDDYAILYCKSGCGNAIILKAVKEEDLNNERSLSLQIVSDIFYSGQQYTFLEKLKRIWYVITNKEYRYFDIYTSDEDEIQKFKSFVEKI